MSSFKKTEVTTLPKLVEPLTDDALFWQNGFDAAKVIKEYGAINFLDLSSTSNHLLVNSMSKISLYNYTNVELIRSYNTMSHFSVYGARFRKSDSKLLICGTEEGKINVYDVKISKPLKFLSEDPKTRHLGPVRCCSFLSDHKISSASDDKTIKLWDLASGELVRDIGSSDTVASSLVKPHIDYIRAMCTIEDTQLIVSGSYDHKVKVWDYRDSNETPKFTFGLESPVEDIIHRGPLLLACGAKTIKIYDLIAGKLFKTITNTHSKTITRLYNYNEFLLSSSLDGQVKIYDSLFNVVTSLSYTPSQLLSLCVNSNTLVVGANDGSVITRNFKSTESAILKKHRYSRQKRYFDWLRDDAAKEEEKQLETEGEAVIVKKAATNRPKLSHYDKHLKAMNHCQALDTVLKKERANPDIIVSVMQELIRRNVLRRALEKRNDKQLKPIFDFLYKNFRDPKFTRILLDVLRILSELYAEHINRSVTMKYHFRRLQQLVASELKLMEQMMYIRGQISAILNSSKS